MENIKDDLSESTIEKELINEIRGVEAEEEKNAPNSSDTPKPILNLEHYAVKSIYSFKKRLQLKLNSSNVPENIRPKLSHLSKVNDEEIELVKRVIDKYGTDNLSPEVIEFINKYINTPLWPLVEMEFALNEKMKADIAMIVAQEASK